MELQLKNIGMIKEANVKLDGLTVIAGLNDTGKSTVGKALFMFLYNIQFVQQTFNSLKTDIKIDINKVDQNTIQDHLDNYEIEKVAEQAFLADIIFKNNIKGAEFLLVDEKNNIHLYIDVDNKIQAKDNMFFDVNKESLTPIVIETPLVWNFIKLVKDLSLIEAKMQINIDYPFIMNDLIFKLSIRSKQNGINIQKKLSELIKGKFQQDNKGEFYFDRENQRIELENTATGIKSFGILQVLSENNWLNNNSILIFDEPEVHLHPKWQLEMAKVIVELVKNGVKVLVNSHSPYMIEALQRYSELAKVNSDFYLAEDGYIKKENDSNSETLAKIFEKLSEPFDVFEEMDSQRMEKLING
jgi:predicted ATPase